jgi:hypothetical protein
MSNNLSSTHYYTAIDPAMQKRTVETVLPPEERARAMCRVGGAWEPRKFSVGAYRP